MRPKTKYHYQVIADVLRHHIESGELAVDEQLPAESKLAAHYGVSTPTVRAALDILQAEGLVEKVQGLGNFVRKPSRLTYCSERYLPGRKWVVESDLEVTVDVRGTEAAGAVARLLQVQAGTPLVEYLYRGYKGTNPQSLARVYVPREVAHLTMLPRTWSPWGDNVRMLLGLAGIQVASTVERITARFLNAEESELLRLASRIPVLAVERTSMDADGRVVEGAFLALLGDRTEAVFTTTHAHTRAPELEDA
ncbi:GntR family transcriptional regulator [Streptomyces morookaense]|uniref:GntR family transcriptional regulator n=1 Tax=Streptomyces morookaense TaxID=1970 RepID=UPI0033EA9CDB